jgi:FKBP-type peptidyl-prolyl cis-trans isomerase FkpA
MSAVTAVPLQPLPKGALTKLWIAILVLVLAGAGLAWWGTKGMQRATTSSGVQVRVVEAGTGEPVTRADLFALRLQVRVGGPSGQLLSDPNQSQPAVASMDTLPPGLAEGLAEMRERGHYQLWVPQRLAMPGGPPPGLPIGPDDKLYFDVEVLQIERGMAALQQLMQQQGAAGGGQPGGMAAPGPGAPPAEGGGPPTLPPPTGNGQ